MSQEKKSSKFKTFRFTHLRLSLVKENYNCDIKSSPIKMYVGFFDKEGMKEEIKGQWKITSMS